MGTGRHDVAHGVHLGEQLASGLLPVVGNAAGDDAFHLEPGGAFGSPPVAKGLNFGPRNPSSEKRPCAWVITT